MESDASSDEKNSDREFYEIPVGEQLRPYDFEPIPSSQPQNEPDTQTYSENDIEQPARRSGNNSWCRCGKCRIMDTEEESLCCHDEYIQDRYLNGKICITEKDNLQVVCLHPEVLKTVLHMLNNMHDDVFNIKNK